MEPLFESDLAGLRLLSRGKVRDIYEIDAGRLLMVQTDRISAFDVVFDDPIPGKGAILTEITRHWFGKVGGTVAHHLLEDRPEDHVSPAEHGTVRDRSLVVRRLDPIPVEAVVRGYLAGSGLQDYRANGSVCGIPLPDGLREAERLPEPIFTPATKAPMGSHDENISIGQAAEIAGPGVMEKVERTSQELYALAHGEMQGKGIILADTKFEFAVGADGELVLIDEALTPDSSRYWPAESHEPGKTPESLDKQHLRNWLGRTGWDRKPPAPKLDADIVGQVADRYRLIRNLIIG